MKIQFQLVVVWHMVNSFSYAFIELILISADERELRRGVSCTRGQIF